MNLREAENVLAFVGVLNRDDAGRAIAFSVPSHPRKDVSGRRGTGSVNIVKVLEQTSKRIVLQCMKDGQLCKASSRKVLCYHCLASMLIRLGESGREYSIGKKTDGIAVDIVSGSSLCRIYVGTGA